MSESVEKARKALLSFIGMIERGEMFLEDLPAETLAGLKKHFGPQAALSAIPAEGDVVAWMDAKGDIDHEPFKPFGVCYRDQWGDEAFPQEGETVTFSEACEAWKRIGDPKATINGWKAGVVADADILNWKFGEPTASPQCPICGDDTPHSHPEEDIADYRECQVHVREMNDARWTECLGRAERLERAYLPCTPLVHQSALKRGIELAGIGKEKG